MKHPSTDLKTALSNALEDLEGGLGGTVDEADLVTQVGATSDEHIIKVSDVHGPAQSETYDVLCDLLATRVAQGIDQVLGCVVFDSEPDATALVSALTSMQRSGVFTPVLPLSRAQATDLATTTVDMDAFLATATSLIAVAADRQPPTESVAVTLLDELAELVDRRTEAT